MQNGINFWKEWKNLGENIKEQEILNIDPKYWYSYFANLYKRKEDMSKDFEKNSITNDINEELNKPFTLKELREHIKKLKNKKVAGYDGITNEMLKCSPDYILNIVLSFFNLSLITEQSSNIWGKGIINPIHIKKVLNQIQKTTEEFVL